MKIASILRSIALLGIVALIAAAALWWRQSSEASHISSHDALISDIRSMVRLCTLDIYEDMPIKGSIGSKHLFGRVTVKGSVSFDLEGSVISERHDTIFVTLPPEIIDIYESTDPDSYKVIDTWNDNFFGSEHFTTAEENAIKSLVRDNFRRKIYRKGYVRRARADAVANLTAMLSAATGKIAIVSDPSPEGYPDMPNDRHKRIKKHE